MCVSTKTTVAGENDAQQNFRDSGMAAKRRKKTRRRTWKKTGARWRSESGGKHDFSVRRTLLTKKRMA